MVFILAVLPKALDMAAFSVQIGYYKVFSEPWLWRVSAAGSIIAETALGIALLTGTRFRGWTHAATLALLAGFTGLIVYSWVYHDLEDCGCFGSIVPMGPRTSIAKNVALMLLVGIGWIGCARHDRGAAASNRNVRLRVAVAAVCVAAVMGALAFGDNADYFHPPQVDKERPFAAYQFEYGGEQWDLGQGDYLVVILTATCPHCQASAEILNEVILTGVELPVAGLVFAEDDDELQEFRTVTEALFPTHLLDGTALLSLIGDEPPRFYITHDGASVRYLDSLEPDLDALLEFVLAEETSSESPAIP